MVRVLKFFQYEMREICPRDCWQKPTTAVTLIGNFVKHVRSDDAQGWFRA
jgi:hypothetical protein